jgi:hypothetical protein
MRPRRLAVLATPIGVLAASQVGHLLASELRQSPRALGPASAGAHAYIPTLTTVALGVAGGLILAALLVVAAARAGRARAGGLPAPRPRRGSVLDLVAALFVLQLAIFLGQETIEAAAIGSPLRDVGDLLLWGAFGQLPVAFVAALAVGWLTARLDAAVDDLAAATGRPLASRWVVAAMPAPPPLRRVLLPRLPAGASSQRGPPSLLPPAPIHR